MQEAILSLNARGRAKGHILAFLTVFVWGITFVSTKVLLTVVTPIEILFLRFMLGFLALCVIHHRVTPSWARASRRCSRWRVQRA